MIKNSHPTCKSLLLLLFNKIWNSCYFPEGWRIRIVLSFLKPGKDPSDVRSYRPFSLTSCVSKLLEKMVNTRLVLVLESKELLPNQQNGFRKMRSTQNCLENVTSNILSALNQKNIALCVSFDIEKAYDKTWRYHILKTLKDLEFKGNLPKFIENFLVRRFFKTKIGVTLSFDHIQEQGVPQGSVISCTLFSLALNGILSVIPNNVSGSLYVDDLLIYSVGNYQTALERRVQLAINHVNNWATSHGFKFSTAKTVSILFHRKRKIQPLPQLSLIHI